MAHDTLMGMKLVRGIAMLFLVAAPLAASALTNDEIRAKIAELQTQLAALQLPPPPGAGIAACPQLPRALGRGARGQDVLSLQMFLMAHGLLEPDAGTGYYGAMTERAIQRWQAAHGIVSSGSAATTGYGAVGPKTRSSLVRCEPQAGASQNPGAASSVYGAANSPAYQYGGAYSGGQSAGADSTQFQPAPQYDFGQSGGYATGVSVPTSSSVPTSQSSGASYADSWPYGQSQTTQTSRQSGTQTGTQGSTQTTPTPSSPASCTLNGQTIQSGQSLIRYQASSVPYGSACASQTRACSNGVLSGSYAYTSCTVQSAPSYAVTTIAANPAAQKPYMGFNTYYLTRVGRFQLNQNSVARISDDMKTYGLTAAGYSLLSFDIGWWYSTTNSPRDPSTHAIIPSPLITDLSGLIARIHANGQTVGAYTDPGIGDASGCGGFPGSGGYISQDVRQFADWGFDFLKLDHCGGNPHASQAGISDPMSASSYEYGLWSSAILSTARATGKQLVFNIGDFDAISNRTADWAPAIGNSWRTQTDIALPPDFPITWKYVLRSFHGNDVPSAASPGHWNDPDYLLIGGFGLTPTEEQSNFNMWAIQAAPLILATDPADLSPTAPDGPRLRAMLLNPEVIAVDQDPLGRQGEKVREDVPGRVVYAKALAGSGSRAVLLLNENDAAASSITVHWGDLGLTPGSASVRDLVARTDLDSAANSYTVTNVPAHGSRLLLIRGIESGSGSFGWQNLAKKTLGNPAVVVNGTVATAAALGTDRFYWIKGLAAAGVTNWTRIRPSGCSGDVIFFGEPTLLKANNAINIFGTGFIDSPHGQTMDAVRTYQAYSYDNGATWTCYGDLGMPAQGVYGRLAAASSDGTTVDLIGRGADNALWYRRYSQSGGWGSWSSAGACVRSGVSASVRPNGVVDIVAIGCNNAVWHGWYTSAPDSIIWEAIPGGTFVGTPASVWNANGTYTVYATAIEGRDIRATTWSSSSGWSAWTSLGACSKAGVAAAGSNPTHLVADACSGSGTNSDTDPTGDRVIYTTR